MNTSRHRIFASAVAFIAFATLSFSQATSIFKVDFGTATPNDFLVKSVSSPYASVGTGYEPYDGTGAWKYGAYTYLNNTDALRAYTNDVSGEDHFEGWVVPGLQDHTPGDVDGRMLLVDGKQEPGKVYQTNVVGLCRESYYNFSAWIANIHATFSTADKVPQIQMEVWSKNPKFESNEFATTYTSTSAQIDFCKNLPDGYVSANGAVLLTKGLHVMSGAPAYSNTLHQSNDQVYIYETTSPGESNAHEVRYKVYLGSDGKYYCSSDGKFFYKATFTNKNSISSADQKRTEFTFKRNADFEYVNPAYFTVKTQWTTSSGYPVYKDNIDGHHFAYLKNGVFYQLVSSTCQIGGSTYYFPKFSDASSVSSSRMKSIGSSTEIYSSVFTSFDYDVYAYLSGSNLLFAYDNWHDLYVISKKYGYFNIVPNWESMTSYVLPSVSSSFSYYDDNMDARWEQINLQFKLVNQSNAYLIMRNFSNSKNGNDFAVDDIEFSPVDKYSVDVDLNQALKEAEGYCSTGEVELTSSITVKPYGLNTVLSSSEEAAFEQELPTYVFYFEGLKDGEWQRINETPVKIAETSDLIEYVTTIDAYKQYEKVRTSVYPSIFSVTDGCRLNVPSVIDPSDLTIPDSPVVTLEASDICPESDDKSTSVTVTNTNYDKSNPWSAKIILSDGTVVNVVE